MNAPKTVVVLPVRFSHGDRAVQTTTRDISEDGVFVRCLEPPAEGAQVALKIYLPGLAAAAEFIGQVREISHQPGDSGFWADFVSAQLDAHESLLRVLSGRAAPPQRSPDPTAPVPLASLYKRVHVTHAPGAPTSAHANPLHAMPHQPPRPKKNSGVGDMIQGALDEGVSEKAAEALARLRGSSARKSAPGRRQTPVGAPAPAAPAANELPAVAAMSPAPAADPAPEAPAPLKDDVVLASDASNRRAFPRYRARFAVRFSSVQDFVLEYAANISAGGVFVFTDHPPEMDAVITVVLELPDGGAPVACKALVVHRVTLQQAQERNSQAGVGVQFIEADDLFRERIDHTLEQILGQAED